MGSLSSKLFLVKPYLPDPSVDWVSVDLATTREAQYRAERYGQNDKFDPTKKKSSNPIILDLGQDFLDPIVREEFNVYMNRDIAPFVMMLIYASSALFFLASIMNITEDQHLWGIWKYAASVILISTAVFDIYCFWVLQPDLDDAADKEGLERRQRISRYRHRCKLLLLFAGFLTMCVVPDFSLRKRNCVHATDWMSIIGFRNKWQPKSDVDWTNSCPRSFHPFPAFFLTIVVVAAPTPSRFALIFDACFLLMNLTSEFWYAYETPLSGTDTAFKVLLYVMVAITGAVCHASRWWSSMTQFKQQLVVVQETSRAAKAEAEVQNLLCSILPPSALNRLSRNEPVSDSTQEATVLFSDIKGFTAWSSTRTARQVVAMLELIVVECDELCLHHGVEKVKTIGDAYWAVAGVPEACSDHALRVCRFAIDFQNMLARQNQDHPEWDSISIRIGIHSGPLDGAILGKQQLSYEVFGDTNTIAAKVEQQGVPGEVCVTEDTLFVLGLDAPSSSVDDIALVDGRRWERLRELSHLSDKPIKFYVLPPLPMPTRSRVGDVQRGSDASSLTEDGDAAPYDGDPASPLNLRAARRRLFKGDAASMMSEETEKNEVQLMAKYGRRRYKHVFPDFVDPTAEQDFITQLRKSKSRYLILTRALLLVIATVIALALFTSDTPVVAASATVSVALFLMIVDLILCAVPHYYLWYLPKIQAVLASTSSLVLVVGTSLGFGASIATGTASPVHFATGCLCLFGNVGYVSAAFQTMVYSIIWIIINAVEWNRFVTPVSFLGSPLSVLMYGFIAVVMERTYRQNFLQLRVARYFQGQQNTRAQERQVLLRAMVPAHVVSELTTWMSRGMKPEESIVTTLPPTCVCFLNLSQAVGSAAGETPCDLSESARADKVGSLMRIHDQVDSILQEDFNTTVVKIKTIGDHVMLAGPFAKEITSEATITRRQTSRDSASYGSTPQEHSIEVSPPPPPLITSSNGQHEHDTSGPLGGDAPAGTKYHQDPSICSGSEVHWGENNEQLRVAVKHMLLVVMKIRARVTTNIRVGMHIGELVGVVLGKSRLCFDIFGDSVNTASRVMTSGVVGDISVSAETYDLLKKPCTPDQCDTPVSTIRLTGPQTPPNKSRVFDGEEIDFPFGEPVPIHAKGKGTIVVYRLAMDSSDNFWGAASPTLMFSGSGAGSDAMEFSVPRGAESPAFSSSAPASPLKDSR